MGVTIHYRLGQELGYLKATLDRAEQFANRLKEEAKVLNIDFEITRETEHKLIIIIGGCEWLVFDFKTMAKWEEEAKNEWQYEGAVLKDWKDKDNGTDEHIKNWPNQLLYWCANFCKTQYADNIAEHKFVAELIRMVAGYCKYSEVNDEGDYYHSGNLENAAESIENLGIMINSIGNSLKTFTKDKNITIIRGGETKIKKS